MMQYGGECLVHDRGHTLRRPTQRSRRYGISEGQYKVRSKDLGTFVKDRWVNGNTWYKY